MAKNQPKMINKQNEDGYVVERKRMQKMAFSKFIELMQRNVNNTQSKKYTVYTKEMLESYLINPDKSISKLREISQYLERKSMLYKKMLMYYASMYMYRYNMIQVNDFNEDNYVKALKKMSKFNVEKYGYESVYNCVRDGIYVAYTYITNESAFFMPLDIDYVRIYGKTKEGHWICYFDASFFDKAGNKDFVETDLGGWDDVFKEGYRLYKEDTKNNKWFRLPPEKTFCMLAVDDSMFATPLPFWLPLFKSLLDLLDLEDIIQDKNELENYKLIVNKIPLLQGSDSVDDFAVSIEMVQQFEQLLEATVPELIGCAVLPGTDIDTVSFENSNNSKDTDTLNQSIENLFSNAGASRLVIASGSSSNSVGLKYSLINDASNVWFFVQQYDAWLNYFVQKNISSNCEFSIHQMTWYLQEDYITQKRELATLGLATPMEVMSAINKTPYYAYQKLMFERNLGIYDKLRAVESSYNSGQNSAGRPQSDDTELTDGGQKTREGNKNEGTRANG